MRYLKLAIKYVSNVCKGDIINRRQLNEDNLTLNRHSLIAYGGLNFLIIF